MFFSFPFLSVFWASLAQVPSSSDASCSHYASVGILFFEFETESVSCSSSFSIFYIFCVRLATRSSDDLLFMLSGQGSHRLRHLVTHHSLIMPLLEFCFESETESVSCSFSFSSFYIFWVRLATRSLNDHFFLIFLSAYMLVFEAFRRDGHVDVSQGSRCSAVAGMVTGRADLGADRAAELQRDPHRSQGARLKRATGIALQRSSHGHRASAASNIDSSNERAFDVHL